MLYALAIIVVGISVAGQLFYKLGANNMAHTDTLIDPHIFLPIGAGLMLNTMSAAGWIYLLQGLSLGKLAPIMALTFVLIPIGSAVFFEEKFEPYFVVGVILIIAGIVISVKSTTV